MSPQPKEKAIKREKRAVEEQDDEEKEEATNEAVDDETKQPPKKRKRESNGDDTEDVWDLVWPCRHGVVGNPGECTVLLQIDPEDAANIDLHGAAGAVGRLEVDAEGGESFLRERENSLIQCHICSIVLFHARWSSNSRHERSAVPRKNLSWSNGLGFGDAASACSKVCRFH